MDKEHTVEKRREQTSRALESKTCSYVELGATLWFWTEVHESSSVAYAFIIQVRFVPPLHSMQHPLQQSVPSPSPRESLDAVAESGFRDSTIQVQRT